MNMPVVSIGSTISWSDYKFRISGFKTRKIDGKLVASAVLKNADRTIEVEVSKIEQAISQAELDNALVESAL